MKHRISLDYTLPEGALAQYFDGVREGRAMASACAGCGRVSYPARSLCSGCRSSDLIWTRLSGRAQVLSRTDGPAASFALVQFAGADTHSTVGILNPASLAQTGRLRAPGAAPGLWIELEAGETDV